MGRPDDIGIVSDHLIKVGGVEGVRGVGGPGDVGV